MVARDSLPVFLQTKIFRNKGLEKLPGNGNGERVCLFNFPTTIAARANDQVNTSELKKKKRKNSWAELFSKSKRYKSL